MTLAQVQERKASGKLEDILVPIDEMFAEYDSVTLKDEFTPLVYNGNVFLPKHLKTRVELADDKRVRVYDGAGHFIAIYKFQKENYIFKLEKMFYDRNEQA